MVMTSLLALLQQKPIVVDLAKQPPPSRDISIDVVLGIFMMAGLFLLAAAVGSLIVAGVILLYKRWRDTNAPDSSSTHTTLRI
jgi:hypothetical protein